VPKNNNKDHPKSLCEAAYRECNLMQTEKGISFHILNAHAADENMQMERSLATSKPKTGKSQYAIKIRSSSCIKVYSVCVCVCLKRMEEKNQSGRVSRKTIEKIEP
jgi:hypothetical protein